VDTQGEIDFVVACNVRKLMFSCNISLLSYRTMKEMYRHLSLDMNDEEKEEQTLDEWTMEKGLAKFFSPEKRELKCEKCSDGRTATQTLRVISCPKFLLLHLKRFTVVEKPRSLTPPPDAVDDKENAEGSSPKKQAAIEMTFHKNKVCIL
jgi:ubiquitin C-terminal hydrolase